MTKGRPPLPPERRRTAFMQVRVTPSAKKAFEEACEEMSVDVAAAHRAALSDWMGKVRK